jgi:hypothetical protein
MAIKKFVYFILIVLNRLQSYETQPKHHKNLLKKYIRKVEKIANHFYTFAVLREYDVSQKIQVKALSFSRTIKNYIGYRNVL